MSSTTGPLDETDPREKPATDTVAAAPNDRQPDDDAAAPRFPKALKAKKKQRKLAAKPNPEKEVEDLKQDNQDPKEPGDAEQGAHGWGSSRDTSQDVREPTSPGEGEQGPGKEKTPKNRRKREARAAAALVGGEEVEAGGRVRSEFDSGKRGAQGVTQSAGGKREARREATAPEAKKAEDTKEEAPPKKENWQLQKAALKEKFPEGWSPRKRLSPDALAGIRALHQQFPEEYTTEVLANKFEVSPEAIRRILKSKWEPQPEEEMERQERWFNRGKRIWSAWAEEGKKPPTKWRQEGITRDPSFHEQRRARSIAQRKLAKTLM